MREVLLQPGNRLAIVCALVLLGGPVAACATASTVDEAYDGGVSSVMPDAHVDGVVFNDTGTMPMTTPDTGTHDVAVAPPIDATTGNDVATMEAAAPSMDVVVVTMPEASTDVATSPPDTGVSPIPTTCAEARHVAGCCANNTNYYCSTAGSTTLVTKACGSKVCTWHSTYYACETGSTPTADPSGTNPIDCK
jgi:hypothetical protein